MTIDDYIEGDQYDWDQSDDSQYCQHGTFIGSWWGPDLLCVWCEGGISVKEMLATFRAQRRRQIEQLLEAERNIIAAFEQTPWSAMTLHLWVHAIAPHLLEQARIFKMSDWEVR